MKRITYKQFRDEVCESKEYEEIKTWPHKHDESGVVFVFKAEDGKYYSGSFFRSYNDGIQDWYFPVDVEEVEKVEVLQTVWRKVKNVAAT